MDRDRIKKQFGAFVLGFVALFLTVSVLSFDRADPPSGVVAPANDPVHNWCGPVGALVAYVALASVGHGVLIVIGIATMGAVAVARGQRIEDPVLQSIGVALVISAACAISSRAFPAMLSPLPVGSGGYLGMAVTGFLERSFSGVGTYLILLASLVTGLLLCADKAILRLFNGTVQGVRELLRPVPAEVGAGRAAKRSAVAVQVPAAPPAAEPTEDAEPDEDPIVPEPADADADGHGEEAEEQAEPEPAAHAELVVRPPITVVEETPAVEEAADEPFEPDAVPGPSNARAVELPGTVDEDELDEDDDLVGRAPAPESDEPYDLPDLQLLEDPEPFPIHEHERQVREKAAILEKTFRDFGLTVRVVAIDTGPVITQFEVALEAGLRVNRVLNLDRDLAIALKAPSVRVVAPLPGKNTVGIEVPNAHRAVVRMKDVVRAIGDEASKARLPLFIGKDASGNPLFCDLTKLPHLLMAGRTGSGKSVCINSMIMSLLLTQHPRDVKMLMVDPKMVELAAFKKIPHLMSPLVTDMKRAEALLAWAVEKMDERYDWLARAGVRSIAGYNRLGADEIYTRLAPASDEERVRIPEHMPYIVIVIDELADLMMTSGKEVELYVTRLAQKSRAVGIHLILATQRPSVDVITGLIKSNLPARLSFQVASRVDSRTILDEMGADKLLGNGDMLFTEGAGTLIRAQGAYVSDEEIKAVTSAIETAEPKYDRELVQLRTDNSGGGKKPKGSKRDELYDEAVKVVIMNQRGSVSLLQRALEVGYSRAARLIDMMAEDGIVGEYQGSQAREVLFSPDEWEAIELERAAGEGDGDGE